MVASFSVIDLTRNSEKKIVQFKESYLEIGIPITPKVYAVFFHVVNFCEKTQKALGSFNQQAMEFVHADLKRTWEKYRMQKKYSEYPSRLLRVLREYNSLYSF